jgi:hypothetical protein
MNKYQKNAKQKKTSQWLQHIEDSASDRSLTMGKRIKKGAAQAALKLVAGIGGGVVGAAMGRWSVLGGVLATGTGEVLGSAELTSFGVGMMASNLLPTDNSVNGTQKKSSMQQMKERMKVYGKGIMQKVGLDKLVSKKQSTSSTKSTAAQSEQADTQEMGQVSYYRHGAEQTDEMDLRELEKYEQQIRESAREFSTGQNQSVNGDISGRGDDDELLNLREDKLL